MPGIYTDFAKVKVNIPVISRPHRGLDYKWLVHYIYIVVKNCHDLHLSQLMRLWYLSHRRPAKAQVSLRIRTVSPEPSLFAHIKYGSKWRVRPKIKDLAPLDGCTCVFEEWVYRGRKVPKSHELAHFSLLFIKLAFKKNLYLNYLSFMLDLLRWILSLCNSQAWRK